MSPSIQSFLRSESFVLIYFIALYSFLLFRFVLIRGGLHIGFVIYLYGFFSMGWSIIPLFVAGDHYWFTDVPPPKFVSRIVLLGLVSFVIVDIIKNKFRPSELVIKCGLTWILVLVFTFVCSLFFAAKFEWAKWLSFTLILCSGGLIALYIKYRGNFALEETALISPVLLGALVIAIIVGFAEISNDKPIIINIFRDEVEVRASSLFHNPNWWAVYVSPAAFYVSYLSCSERGLGRARILTSVVIMAALTLCLSLSGSRSVSALLFFSMLALIFSGFAFGYRIQTFKILVISVSGGAAGIIAGLLASFVIGSRTFEKYVLLLKRVFLWPEYILYDANAQQSVAGRLGGNLPEAVFNPHQVVDSAWIFALQGNPALFALMVVAALLVVFLAALRFFQSRKFENLITIFLSIYILAAGSIGQVYWAFPVWISVFLAIGVCLKFSAVTYRPASL